jgi:hypothetical protein
MFSQIYEGWRNNLLPPKKLKEEINRISNERISICKQCEHHSANKKNYKTIRVDAHCTECGCTLSAKTKCLSCSCPLNFWEAVATLEQEEQMKKDDNGKQ